MRVIDYGRLLLAALWGASFCLCASPPRPSGVEQRFLRVLFAAIALGLLLGVQGKWSGYQGKFTSTLQLGSLIQAFLSHVLPCRAMAAGRVLRHA